jgi:hypothetical protein
LLFKHHKEPPVRLTPSAPARATSSATTFWSTTALAGVVSGSLFAMVSIVTNASSSYGVTPLFLQSLAHECVPRDSNVHLLDGTLPARPSPPA